MDAEKQKLTPEQLKDVTGGESAWWTGDTSTYLYICHNCWRSTDVGHYA